MALENIAQKTLLFAFNKASNGDKDYSGYVKKTPSFIQNNGLLYTLAYLNKKSDKLAEHIREWHVAEHNVLNLDKAKCTSIDTFLKELLIKNDSDIRLLTLETLALLKCLRRFVKEDN